jgi:PST family polysaccharide transporter
MIKKLKAKFIATNDNKNLINNIFSLSILHGLNYILPMLTIPYLVRVLGPEYFGLLAYVTSIISFFILITDYGFNLSATRQVSIHREDKKKINDIFSSVMTIKIALLLITLVVLSIFIFSIDKFNENWELYFITFGMVFGSVIYPVWLFQGLERMKYITYLDVGFKGLFTSCIFLFVKEPADYLLVPLLTSMGFITAGIGSLILVRKKFEVKFISQSLSMIKFQLKEGWYVFFSSIGTTLYTNGTVIILGLFTNNSVVGYFAAAEKIVRAGKKLYAPIAQAIYPSISLKIKNDKKAGLQFIRKTSFIIGSVMLVLSFSIFIFAEPIVSLLLGNQFQQSIIPLKIMAFLPFIFTLSNILGVQTMLNLDYGREYSLIIIITSVFSIAMATILIFFYKSIGASLSLLITQILILVILSFFMIYKIKNQKKI